MKRAPLPRIIAALAALLCALVAAARPAAAQAPSPDSYSLISHVPRSELDEWLKSEVKASGGDFAHQRYNFIIGFSTGHYAQDPVHAIAMRRLAFSLLNNTLAAGDRVTMEAWEMKLADTSEPVTLTDEPGTRAQLVNDTPYAPVPGSRGGHDVERALYDTLTHQVPRDDASSTVILLLTNSNESQAPPGYTKPLFGANNPRLSAAAQKLDFRYPPERHTFQLQAGERRLNVDVTALFPQHIEPLSDAPTTPRYPTFARDTWQPAADRPAPGEILPNPSAGGGGPAPARAATVPGAATRSGWRPWVFIAIVLLLFAAAAAWAASRARGRGAPPAAVVRSAPAAAAIPGVVRVTVGAEDPIVLDHLTAESGWDLVRSGQALTLQTPEERKERPDDPAAAAITLLPDRRLQVEAQNGAQFSEIRGSNTQGCSNGLLVLAPGEVRKGGDSSGNQIVCRVLVAGIERPVRLALSYAKGS